MKVSRVAEHPRITKPFSDESWDELNELGEKVDRILEAEDVHLTMGGEPTFVSIDDFQSEEWNTAAVGPTKREKADVLIRKLQERRPRRFRITARANGIRAKACRAGPSRSTGAATASRSGRTSIWSPPKARIPALPPRMPAPDGDRQGTGDQA